MLLAPLTLDSAHVTPWWVAVCQRNDLAKISVRGTVA